MPQVSTSSKAGPGTKIIYCIIIHIYAFDETLTCIWIILWCISLEWHEAYLDDGFTQTIPPPLPPP
jgi:hypothetical protein